MAPGRARRTWLGLARGRLAIARDGRCPLRRSRIARALIGEHVASEGLGAVPSISLGGVERAIGVSRQACAVSRMIWEDSNPDAGRDRSLDRGDGDRSS